MKKIAYTLLFALIMFGANAQDFKGYVLKMPSTIKPNTSVKKIFVEGLQCSNSENINEEMIKTLNNIIVNNINSNERGGNIEFIPNTWLRSDIYQVTQNKDEADWIFTGTYEYFTSKKRDQAYEVKRETSTGTKYKLPFELMYYDYANEIRVPYSLKIVDKTGAEIFSAGSEFKNSSAPEKNMVSTEGKLQSFDALAKTFSSTIGNWMANAMLPIFTPVAYEFEKVKGPDKKTQPDKEKRKAIDDQLDNARDMLKDHDFVGAGMIYQSLIEECPSADLFLNLAMIYEIIGNYTKSLEYYQKANNAVGITRIKSGIEVRDMLKAFGKTIEEVEL